ncbi:hypothetical protein B566_EDAN012266 [Ephemera danica]|nr:hypothetical protein B566_EDAN012266 [Ephemera danica]
MCCDVFDAAVKLINTERMWTLYLEALTELNQDTEHLPKYKHNLLLKALQEAHNAGCMPEKFYLQWLTNQKMMEQVYQQGLLRGPEVSNTLKTMYLEWIVLSRGIVAARKAYDVVSMQPPFSLELHTKMVELESLQPEQNLKQTRKCYELACDQFGRSTADVWIDYIKFEMKKGNAVNMASISWRATKTLNPIQCDIFLQEYSLLKMSMS